MYRRAIGLFEHVEIVDEARRFIIEGPFIFLMNLRNHMTSRIKMNTLRSLCRCLVAVQPGGLMLRSSVGDPGRLG